MSKKGAISSMSQWLTKTGLTITALTCVLLCSGCLGLFLTGTAVGMGTIVYKQGELVSVEPADVKATFAAAEKALADMDALINVRQLSGLDAMIEATVPNGWKIRVTMERVDYKETRVGIRIGKVGHEEYSMVILEKIRKHLK
jgi:hypothetical protein